MLVINIAGIYLILGIIFVIPFLLKGIYKIDEGAIGTPLSFKLIIVPGVIAFWPFLLKKWISRRS